MGRISIVAAFGAALALSLSACADGPQSAVDGENAAAMGASVRASANPDAPWAAYFTVRAGARERVIIGASVDGADRVELHESRVVDGMVTMAPLTRVVVPAGGEVVFRPGGRHAMLFGVTPAARAAGRMTVTLRFDDGTQLPVELAFAPQPDVASAPPPPEPGPLVRPNDPRIEGNIAPVAAPPSAPHHSEIEHSEGGNDEHGEHQGH